MTKVNESGRSMVEMLGVLAIIGVLSIGGIAGYTMAMNRYRANEILNTAAQLSILAMTKNGGAGGTVTLDSLPGIQLAGIDSASDMTAYDNGVVDITVNSSFEPVSNMINELAGGKMVTGSTNCVAGCSINMQASAKKAS